MFQISRIIKYPKITAILSKVGVFCKRSIPRICVFYTPQFRVLFSGSILRIWDMFKLSGRDTQSKWCWTVSRASDSPHHFEVDLSFCVKFKSLVQKQPMVQNCLYNSIAWFWSAHILGNPHMYLVVIDDTTLSRTSHRWTCCFHQLDKKLAQGIETSPIQNNQWFETVQNYFLRSLLFSRWRSLAKIFSWQLLHLHIEILVVR